MAIDPRWFVICNEMGLVTGQRVRYWKHFGRVMDAFQGHARAIIEGEGEIVLIWYGISEVVDVRNDDGTITHLHPELHDLIEVIE